MKLRPLYWLLTVAALSLLVAPWGELAAAIKTRVAKPVIKAQPVPAAVKAGGTAKFSVKATGSKLKYQWQKGSAN